MHSVAGVVQKETSLQRDEIGVNLWLVRGPIGFRRLVREASATGMRSRTPIMWTKGKGVIGQAWERKKTRHADVAKFREGATTGLAFCRLPAEDRFRLTWEEFEELNRYQEVLAVPLRRERFARHTVRGVIAIDVLAEGPGAQLKGLQATKEFDSIRRTCEATLAGNP